MQLNTLQVEDFLRDSWQKKPVVIRNAWASWSNPLEPDELAGLACENGVESRLVTQREGAPVVEHGPFAEARFAQQEPDPWTLLVQAVDHHVPDVAALLDPFRFVPNWRIDDVMVSYATDQGGVGAHYDQYDVFLIQGLGRRRWQVGALCDEQTELLPHEDLRLLAHFEATEEWILEPGDILYVPPGVAHNGIAIGGDCMTYSIGFRAPSRADLITEWSEHIIDQLDESDRYADPGLVLQENPGEITDHALRDLQALITENLADRREFARWFGRFTTAPKNPDLDWSPEECLVPADLGALSSGAAVLVRNPASRFSFVREGTDHVILFVDGHSFECAGESAAFARRCCATDFIATAPMDMDTPSTVDLIVALLNLGSLEIAGDEDD